MKTAIITGVSGMDGSILADQLLEQDYKVYGLVRRTSRGANLGNAQHLSNHPNFIVQEGDLLDLSSLTNLCKLAKADIFINTAAQSHVGTSFNQPIYTGEVTGLGVLNCLEAIRLSGIHTRFLQCSSSEMYGGISSSAANEQTPFYPKSPYGVAKLYGYWITINYRESYKMFACNSICFNHEHMRRSDTFVTKKITKAVVRIKHGLQDVLYLGNLDARRDWGWAPDFCRGIIDILTKTSQPDDYVLATGETHSVREFCIHAFNHVGLHYEDYVKIDPILYRPAEVNVLLGDYRKIQEKCGWSPSIRFEDLVTTMVDYDEKELLAQK